MKQILLLLSEGFEILEASVFIDVFGWNLVEGDGSTQLFTCGLKKEIPCAFNQRFIVDHLIDDISVDDFEALAIPGGFEEYAFYKESFNPRTLRLIDKFNHQNKIIASICVGALVLGKAGILKKKNATTYQLNKVRQEALKKFGANVLDEPIVIDDNIITSCGPSTAIEVAFILLEKLTSTQNAYHIKNIMGFC